VWSLGSYSPRKIPVLIGAPVGDFESESVWDAGLRRPNSGKPRN